MCSLRWNFTKHRRELAGSIRATLRRIRLVSPYVLLLSNFVRSLSMRLSVLVLASLLVTQVGCSYSTASAVSSAASAVSGAASDVAWAAYRIASWF